MITDKDRLLELASQFEAAAKPSFELFAAAFEAIHGGRSTKGETWSCFCSLVDEEAWLDAAMTLVPSTHYWSAGTTAQDGYEHCDDMDIAWAQVTHRERGESVDCNAAATPALALCAASLRAIAEGAKP